VVAIFVEVSVVVDGREVDLQIRLHELESNVRTVERGVEP
jgi:hypothetical protein